MDTATNIVSDFASNSISVKSPRYIRDIKDNAKKLGIKGTKKLNKFLNQEQNKAFLINRLVDAAFSVGSEIGLGYIQTNGQRPATYRGLVI